MFINVLARCEQLQHQHWHQQQNKLARLFILLLLLLLLPLLASIINQRHLLCQNCYCNRSIPTHAQNFASEVRKAKYTKWPQPMALIMPIASFMCHNDANNNNKLHIIKRFKVFPTCDGLVVTQRPPTERLRD